MLIETSLKCQLSKEIQKEYNKLANIISDFPESLYKTKKIDGTGGLISIADILAYQIGWGKLLISWYEDGIVGKNPMMPGEGFTKWDYTGIAKHFYQKYQFSTKDQRQDLFHQTVVKILNIVEIEYQNENLDKIGVWSWCTLPSGKKWTLSKWITVNTKSPYRKAASEIRKFLKRNQIK